MTTNTSVKIHEIQFKGQFLSGLQRSGAQKIALLVSNEYEGLTNNGGIGTYYTSLSKALKTAGWCTILLLCQSQLKFNGTSSIPALDYIFSTDEAEDLLIFQPTHLSLMQNARTDYYFTYQSICTLLFVQACSHAFSECPLYVEFPEVNGFGYHTIQAKQSGFLKSNCITAVTIHGCFEWVFEANDSLNIDPWLLATAYREQHSFEKADLAFFPSYFLKSTVDSYGWSTSHAKHMPYFIPISPKALNSRRFRIEARDNELKNNIRNILLNTYFKGSKEADSIVEAFDRDIKDHTYGRYNQVIDFTIPWVNQHYSLLGKTLIEVGCGTGSSTAAFAHFVDEVYAYDIQGVSIEAARQRLDAMSLHNVIFYPCSPELILSTIKKNHPEGVNCVLLFAVLEHMTVAERIDTLRTIWGLLQPGGIIIITETPNRLSYWDHHTSQMPFLHLLPEELYLQYYRESPRMEYVSVVDEARQQSEDEAREIMVRWGAFGVSYHEFEVALGEKVHDYIIANGFEDEILSQYPMTSEDHLLKQYFLEKLPTKNIGFSRAFLHLILKKGESQEVPDSLPSLLGMTSHEEQVYVHNFARNDYTGQGEIVDLGCFLGSLTIPLVIGLQKNPKIEQNQVFVHAYDIFKWESWMDSTVVGTSLENRYQDGDSFLDAFLEQTHPWQHQLKVYQEDLTQSKWDQENSIEFLIVDAMKSWDLTNSILQIFFPALIPGVSLIQHQDFAHYYTSWIHLIMYRLKDYFSPVSYVPFSSMFFRYEQAIPQEILQRCYSFQDFCSDEIDRAFEYSIQIVPPEARSNVAASKVMLYIHLGDIKKAQTEFQLIKSTGLPIPNTDLEVVENLLSPELKG